MKDLFSLFCSACHHRRRERGSKYTFFVSTIIKMWTDFWQTENRTRLMSAKQGKNERRFRRCCMVWRCKSSCSHISLNDNSLLIKKLREPIAGISKIDCNKRAIYHLRICCFQCVDKHRAFYIALSWSANKLCLCLCNVTNVQAEVLVNEVFQALILRLKIQSWASAYAGSLWNDLDVYTCVYGWYYWKGNGGFFLIRTFYQRCSMVSTYLRPYGKL